jgi:Cu/Ag efflux pump CusA
LRFQGVAAEFGVVMLIYLKHALEVRQDGNSSGANGQLRVRPRP